ncbi:hypothetical protein BAUCODRAFT_536505 [Baudoinia panamericana UAMH 10762]|uniref:Uncharacterized protein n=1 Tax=Baudoinia panamericana (strain UAMH 10762) TaxID=717646 RepID=M2MFA9_BAUPA|nr:uncharacterized protein BAUCODRAFT_536505 [Baudoinia panamericana UAMH 10762]EMC95326.1 hypothetical protein BAUCODRAFT_536505 [Baudoinia panamericana UAMH 10762]
MRSILSQLLAIGPELAAFILTSPILHIRTAHAVTQSSIPSPNLDLTSLGRVAIAGDFDSISLYTFAGQNENIFNTNGSQSLLTRYPNGAFQSLGLADAYIRTMCPFIQKDGSLAGVVVGGNFTSLGGVEAQSIALWNPNTTQITALPGLSGSVSAVYCDDSSGTVYVGGMFMGGNSTNAIAWTTGWTNLPFAGFNGPVTSITKNAAGNIVFGGDFDGLGNATTPQQPDGQVVNLGSARITTEGTTAVAAYSNPSSIICNTGQSSSWLLADDTTGYWQGNFSFGFNPTKLRLYNTQQDGRGTRQFYFQILSTGGILNLDYYDANGQPQSCSAPCPLANNASAQDFHFVPPVGMNAFRIVITGWYGAGGGLSGIEMFQDDIYSFAVNDFNEPQCDSVSTGSSATAYPASGVWTRRANNGNTSSDYLSASLNATSQIGPSTSVVFSPDIRQSGNYSIMLYTPGCIQDDSCSSRGLVNITTAVVSNQQPSSTTLYQTNNYDKYDQVYYGYVDVDTDSFKPTVTLTPLASQGAPLTVVAQRVRFELITTTGGLNGLFEYNPNIATVSTDFSSSAINAAGASLNAGAQVNIVQPIGSALYIAGSFTDPNANISNIMSINQNATTALPNGGLNGAVQTLYRNGTVMYMGGNFTNVAQSSIPGLANLAAFDTANNRWTPLGAGVNGPVTALVELALNVTEGNLEDCLSVNGIFTSVNGFASNAASASNGFAIWVPGRNNWLHNIPQSDISIQGQLTTMTQVPGFTPLYAGQISSQAVGLSGAVELVGSGQPALQSLGLRVVPGGGSSGSNSSAMRKRAISSSSNYTGVYQGLFHGESGLNITILAGRFEATTSNGSTVSNLVFLNNTAGASQTVTGVSGLDADSTFVSLATYQIELFAGGQVTGSVHGNSVNGLVVYDLATGAYTPTQPPALQNSAGGVIVNAIMVQPNTAAVYVGGQFSSAGSLPCSTLCYYDASARQWNTPGSGLAGTVNAMIWSTTTELVVAGNLSVAGMSTQLVRYDSKAQTYAPYSTTGAALPGPISVLTNANTQNTAFWAAGVATGNNSAYLAKYAGNTWTGVAGLGVGTTIRGLQLIDLTGPHGNTELVPATEVLMVMGNINLPSFGNVSAALFNGTTFQPFVLTNTQSGSQGSVGSVFVRYVPFSLLFPINFPDTNTSSTVLT